MIRSTATGWVPDPPDSRDQYYAHARQIATQAVPEQVDFRKTRGKIEDQGLFGTCVAHAVTGALEYPRPGGRSGHEGRGVLNLSRAFLHYESRMHDPVSYPNGGTTFRSALTVASQEGIPPESLWPYTAKCLARKPDDMAYAGAHVDLTKKYLKLDVTDIFGIRSALAEGYPIVFGMVVFKTFFDTKRDGLIPIPAPHELIRGTHAMLIVGYTPKYFIMRNSFGAGWGDQGYGYMPVEYLLAYPHYSWTFWAVGG